MSDTDPRKETWDDYWRSEDHQCGPHPILIERIVKYVRSRGAVIAEIGAGSGADALEIASRGYTVVVLDISAESLKVIRSRTSGTEIDVLPLIGDALNLPFKKNSLDLVYHQGVMEHFKNPLPFLSQQEIVLKNGGRMLTDVPQTLTAYTLKKKWIMAKGKWFAAWETQYTPRRLRRVLKSAGWRVLEIYGRDYEFLPFVWLRDIGTLGKTRFGRPIVPRFISGPISRIWRFFEDLEFSNYIKLCIGAVAAKNEDSV